MTLNEAFKKVNEPAREQLINTFKELAGELDSISKADLTWNPIRNTIILMANKQAKQIIVKLINRLESVKNIDINDADASEYR